MLRFFLLEYIILNKMISKNVTALQHEELDAIYKFLWHFGTKLMVYYNKGFQQERKIQILIKMSF